MEDDFILIGLRLLFAKYLDSQEYTEENLIQFDELGKELERWGSGFTQYLLEHDKRLSLTTWHLLATNCLYNWSEEAWRLPDQLEPILDMFVEEDTDPDDLETLEAIFGALADMGRMEFGNRQDVSGALGMSLAKIGEKTETSHPGNAHDFASHAMAYFNNSSAPLTAEEEQRCVTTEQLHLRLAIAGGKLEQLATARHAALRRAVRCSENDPGLKDVAFRAMERLVEASLALPEGKLRDSFAQFIQQYVSQVEWLRPAALTLAIGLNDAGRQQFIRQFSFDPIVERVRRFPNADEKAHYLASLVRGGGALLADVEKERTVLSLQAKPDALFVDWTDWRIDHHAYRQAIPQGKSFLREKKFAENLAYYVHEITHVLTLCRHLGFYLYTFKAWIWALEIIIEGIQEGDGKNLFKGNLPPGDARLLPFVQQQIEIAQRVQIVQDVWVPWFEGLAAYAESAVIPSDDPVGISTIIEALRGLVDVNPGDGEDPRAAFEEQYQEFETLASEALIRVGHRRMYELFFGNANAPIYTTGYTAVRRVAAELRAKSDRDMTGAEIFGVLLNATQYGLLDYLPDPNLPLEEFEARCRQLMCDWAKNLLSLSSEDIALITLLPTLDAKGQSITWKNGKPVPAVDTEEQAEKRICDIWDALSDKIIGICDPDITPPSAQGGETRELESALGALSRTRLSTDFAKGGFREKLRNLQSQAAETSYLLPVGTVECNFLTADTKESDHPAHIFLPLVTTVAHVESEEPSVNGLMLVIEKDDFSQIKAIHGREKDPLLRVSRVIDLAGVGMGNPARAMHYIVMQYHEWSYAYPAILSLQSPEWEDRRKGFLNVAAARLGDPGGENIHVSLRHLAKRISTWLDSGWSWRIDGAFVSIPEWEASLKAQVDRLQDTDTQRIRIAKAGKDLLAAVGITEPLARTLSDGGFEQASETEPHLRDGFVEYALATARKTDGVGAPPELPEELVGVFVKRENGWDF